MPRPNIPEEINLCPWGRKCHFGDRCRHGASGHYCYFDWNSGTCHKPAGVCKFLHRCEVIPNPFPTRLDMILPTHFPSKDATTQTSVNDKHTPSKETPTFYSFAMLQESVGDDDPQTPTLKSTPEPSPSKVLKPKSSWASVVMTTNRPRKVLKPKLKLKLKPKLKPKLKLKPSWASVVKTTKDVQPARTNTVGKPFTNYRKSTTPACKKDHFQYEHGYTEDTSTEIDFYN